MKKNLWTRYGLAAFALTFGIVLTYQNCSPVRFSTEGSNLGALTGPGGQSTGTDTCVPSINVAPQLSFVPSSFDVGQQFQVMIDHQNLYTSITIDFGDGTTPAMVSGSSTSPITHTYQTQSNFIITASGTDTQCGTNFSATQNVAVTACTPSAVTVETSLTPTVPAVPPVGSFATEANITNSDNFTSAQWLVNSQVKNGGADVSLTFGPGQYILQAQAVDTCGTSRTAPPVPICVAASGNPVVTVVPSTFTAGIPNTFTVTSPGNYQSLNIDFGDGTTSAIPIMGDSAGAITHTYSTSGSYNYVVTGVDTCGFTRVTSTPVTISPASCTSTQADGCVDSQYCTGRTSCNPQGNCSDTCNQCGYLGAPVTPVTSCNETGQQCVTGGTSCDPTNTCHLVCGQCGYTGTPVTPVTTCNDGEVCVTGGTSCNPTQNCTKIPGQCGDPLPTPTPTPWVPAPKPSVSPISPRPPLPRPTSNPTSTPKASATPYPPTCNDCNAICGGYVQNSCMIDSATCGGSFCGFADANCACTLGFTQCFCQGRFPAGHGCGVSNNCASQSCIDGICQ